MGLPVLVLGESGSGKSYSIKNMEADSVGIFAVEKGLLPNFTYNLVDFQHLYNTIGSRR